MSSNRRGVQPAYRTVNGPDLVTVLQEIAGEVPRQKLNWGALLPSALSQEVEALVLDIHSWGYVLRGRALERVTSCLRTTKML